MGLENYYIDERVSLFIKASLDCLGAKTKKRRITSSKNKIVRKSHIKVEGISLTKKTNFRSWYYCKRVIKAIS